MSDKELVINLIRELPESASQASRYEAAFKGVAGDRWRLFSDAGTLGELANVP